uniref:MMS19 nucleotide excision repair protein n=1 Tax=Cyclopterus lumpus TaxID=8103 RepID=A0A8C3AZ69_CYCLU
DGQFTILQLVESAVLRSGTQHMKRVIFCHHVSLSLFSAVEVLIAFFENRLKDHYVITPPVLQGLRALTKSTVLPPGSAVSMLRSLFQDVHVQVILTKTLKSQQGLGADFVFGFVQSMDGERDPRNLLLAFQIAKSIVRRGYDLGKFTEELFEVTSCYFPIDFSPPPNDPHGITREELIQMLRDALTGTPRFAEFLLPLIIEKLDSDVLSAKLDSLQTLIAGVSQYEHKDVAEFLEGLWASLRREVFQTSSEKIESAGLAALTALTSCLSRSVLHSDSEDSLSTFLDLVLKDCKHHLCEPDLKLVWPSAKLLQAACSASNRASHIITDAVMPSLVEQYNSRAQCSHRRTLLEVVQRFIQSAKTCENEDSVFLAFRPSLCSMVFSALTETDSSLTASILLSLPGLLLAVVECAGALAELHPAAFITKLIPRLKKEMFSEPMDQGDNRLASETPSHHAVRQRCLSALAAVSTQPSVVQESTPVLLEVLSSAHTGNLSGKTVEEVVLACHSLQRIAKQVQDTEETGRCFHDVIIPRLLSLALQAALCSCLQVAKALLLRYHPLFTTLTDKLFSLLDDADLGPAAADGFRLLMSESTDILNRGCHADVRIMYRQRFFSENSAKLVQGFNAAPQEKKPNYLKALSNIVNKLPKQVQVTELPALLSLLLEALSCPDQGVQLSTLSCLEPVLVDPPPALIQQLEALVSRLLALTSSPVMSVRIASLRCIHAISCFPEHEVLPFRTRVLRALARPLDDRKRLVRRGAVRARAEW